MDAGIPNSSKNQARMDAKMKELLIKKIMEEKKDLARKFMVAVAKALDPELGDRAEGCPPG